MPDGQVVFEITADGKQAKAAINDVVAAMKKAGVDVDKSAQTAADSAAGRFESAFNKLAASAAAAKAGKMLLDFGKEAVQAASDLQEVQNVVDVTFGSNANIINNWAQNASRSFGLTETQAKRFTSTLGAMMKSAGMGDNEIVQMSTDLAGLAADMASFYNLDFDTAFQKIRSGISGETEPLKQLGINMSVANLEAFALEKGITKAFNAMSQGEQTALRYQYIMQATADAQGDFARTSDGYANATRMLETNLDQLKTSVGSVLLPVIANAVGGINDLFAAFRQDVPQETALDKLAAIDLKTDEKIAQIHETAVEAQGLVETLEGLAGKSYAQNSLEAFVNSFSGSLTGLDDALTAAKNADYEGTLKGVASALELKTGTSASDWTELLDGIANGLSGTGLMISMYGGGVSEFLSKASEAANNLGPDAAKNWQALVDMLGSDGTAAMLETLGNAKDAADNMTALIAALSGGEIPEDQREKLNQLYGEENLAAAQNLASLGMQVGDISEAHETWLNVCQRLVSTIPSLNSLINTETGEIKGGTDAVRQAITEWEQYNTLMAEAAALEEKRKVVADNSTVNNARDEMYMARGRVKVLQDEFDALGGQAELDKFYYSATRNHTRMTAEQQKLAEAYKKLTDAQSDLEKKTAEYNRQAEAQQEAMAAIDAEAESVTESYNSSAQALSMLTMEQEEAAKTALDSLAPALQQLSAYYEKVRSETAQSVGNTLGMFGGITTPAEEARQKVDDLTASITKANAKEINLKITGLEESIPSIQNMTKGLQDQIDYIEEYQRNLEKARDKGLSAELLAGISSGSAEDFDYLAAIADATTTEIEELNTKYAEAKKAKDDFVTDLTSTKLENDSAFNELVDAVNTSMTDLETVLAESGAPAAMGSTMDEIIAAVTSRTGSLQSAIQNVVNLMAQLDSLSSSSFGYSSGGKGLSIRNGGGLTNLPVRQFAIGLDYVPFDGFLASLHAGESILTAEEARVWRNFKFGQQSGANSIDYGAMGSAIGANMPNFNGMTVRWKNGAILGDIVSEQQANNYNRLERSGWHG